MRARSRAQRNVHATQTQHVDRSPQGVRSAVTSAVVSIGDGTFPFSNPCDDYSKCDAGDVKVCDNRISEGWNDPFLVLIKGRLR